MLLSLMRKHAKSWLIKSLIAIIAIVFVFYFGYSFRSETGAKIAYVNGELICCMSLAALMEIPGGDEGAAGRKAYPRLVVVARQGHRFAFAADEVLGVRRFPREAVQDLPATAAKSVRALTAGILPGEDRTIGLIAEEKLFAALTRSLAP